MQRRLKLAVACVTGLSAAAFAQSHYPIGLEGLKGAALPAAGWHVQDYNLFSGATRLNDADGTADRFDFRSFTYVNALRPRWVTPLRVLGADYSADVLVPLLHSEVETEDFHDDAGGLGDILVEPLTLSWHGRQFDALVGYGFWAPTGDDHAGPVSPGLGLWTHMFTVGSVWYPDVERRWSASALLRYEINTEADGPEVTPGDTFSLEWGLGRTVGRALELGVAGYFQRQLTTDRGPGPHLNSLDTVAALGPEVRFDWARAGVSVALRYACEFLAEDRQQGHLGVLTVSKRF